MAGTPTADPYPGTSRALLALSLSLLSAACANGPPSTESPPDSPAQGPVRALPPRIDDGAFLAAMADSVVTLMGEEGELPARELGVAFFVAGDRVAACHHQLLPEKPARIRLVSGETFPVVGWLWSDPDQDAALLQVGIPAGRARPLAVNGRPLLPGERVALVRPDPFQAGRCLASYGAVEEGVAPGTWDGGGERHLRALARPGWSGSPVLDGDGEVVGIVRSGLEEGLTGVVQAGALAALAAVPPDAPARPLPEASARTSLVERWKPPSHLLRILASALRNGQDGTEAAITEHLARHPRDADAWFLLASKRGSEGRTAEALADMAKAVECRPTDGVFRLYLGQALLQEVRVEEALVHLEKGNRIEHDLASQYAMAYAYHLLGRDEEAIATYERILREQPDHADARKGLVFAKHRLGRKR